MSQPLKILMLEDSSFDAELIQRHLKKEKPDALFHIAMTPEEFSIGIREIQPDLILADNSLPQFNAQRALEMARQQLPNVPFILVTGTVSDEFAAGIIKAGADDYILKDRLTRLSPAIDAALKQRRIEKEKQEAFQGLIRSEERYRTLIERVSDAFIAVDKNWCYTFVNKKAGELIRRDPEKMIGKNVWDEFPDAVGSATYEIFIRAMKEQQYMSNTDHFPPLNLWQENYVYPSPDGLSVFIRDITEKKKAEELLKHSYEELRQLALHLQDVREEERAAMSREIHDELGQQLTGLRMDVSWFFKKIPIEDPVLKQKSEHTMQLLDNMVKSVRKIAAELRPSILDDFGLVEALRWQSKEFEKRSGIKTEFRSGLTELQLTSNAGIALFRIFQESLTNVARHAEATTVSTWLEQEEDKLILTISDNGKGFDPDKTGQKKTLGLRGMRERTIMMGGLYEIKSQPGKGTTVSVMVPLQSHLRSKE